MPRVKYPINNTIKRPYWVDFLLSKELVNIRIKQPTKESAKPEQVVLEFDNEVIKILIVDTFGLTRFYDKKSSFQNELTLIKWYDARKETENVTEQAQAATLSMLIFNYCREFRTYLVKTYKGAKKTLQEFNSNFDAEAFEDSLTQQTNVPIDIDTLKTLNVVLNNAISEALAAQRVGYGIKQAEAITRAASSSSALDSGFTLPPSLNLSIQTSQSLISTASGTDEKEEHSPTESPVAEEKILSHPAVFSFHADSSSRPGELKPRKVFSSDTYVPPPLDEEMKQQNPSYNPLRFEINSPTSPTSPTGAEAKIALIGARDFSPDMYTFLSKCILENQLNPLPARQAIYPADVCCTISEEVCQVPAFAGGKLYDVLALRKLATMKEGYFHDKDSHTPIYKSALIPAPDVRNRIRELIRENNFYQAFLQHYAEDYQKAGRFKWSNFNTLHKKGVIHNYETLFNYVVNNPDSRSAKVFANMQERVDDRFKVFMQSYIKDYQLKSFFFKRSNFLKKVRNHTIANIEDTEDFANADPTSRTSRVFKAFPRPC